MNESEILNTIGQFVAPLTQPPSAVSPDDVVKVGAALLVAAETIFKAAGGPSLAAALFYAAADRCARQSA